MAHIRSRQFQLYFVINIGSDFAEQRQQVFKTILLNLQQLSNNHLEVYLFEQLP